MSADVTVDEQAPLPDEDSAEQLYEHAPCGYLSTAPDGTVVRANQTLLGWLGYDAAAVVERVRLADLLPTGQRLVWLTHHVPRLERTGEVSGVMLDLLRADGSLLPALLRAVVVPGADGAARLVRVIVFDGTERLAYEANLVAARRAAEEAEARARALQKVTEACALATTTQELLDTVAATVAEAWDAAGCVVWLGEGEAMLPAAVSGEGDTGAWDPSPARVLARAARSGDPTTGPDARGGLVVAVPVTYGEETLGLLAVHDPRRSPAGSAASATHRAIGALVGQALARTRLHAELQRRALTDPLTGLPNRVLLKDRIRQGLARLGRDTDALALLLVDLDGFKTVNDTHGHTAGDRVLVTCADRLRAAVREADTVARLAGDEFVVLAEHVDVPQVEAIAERIRAAVAETIVLEDALVRVTASVGVVVHGIDCDHQLSPDELFATADRAMYAAKRRGKDCVVVDACV